MERKLRRYYLYGLLPALAVTLVLAFVGDYMLGCFFMLGFIWPYSNYTPNMREKLTAKPKRLSLISISIECHDLIFKYLKNIAPHFILRALIPTMISIVIFFITNDYSSFIIIWGLIGFEIFYYLNDKKSLNLF